MWPVRLKTAAANGAGVGAAAGSSAASLTGNHPCPLLSSSNLTLYQHKSRWQTYLPSLAAWEGVEGSSVSLSPAYDDARLRREAIATDLATASTSADDTDSVQPQSSSHTDLDDYTTATAATADEDDVRGAFGHDDANDDDDDDDDDDEEEDDIGQEDDDEDAILAVWSPAMVSFVADTHPSPSTPITSAGAHNRARRRRQQRQQQQQQQKRPETTAPRPAYPIQHRRVAAMTPLSSSMLRHYIVETAPILATCRAARNPYIAAFLPLAYTDDLVMHCILAIGGAHLSNRLTKPRTGPVYCPASLSGNSSSGPNLFAAPASSHFFSPSPAASSSSSCEAPLAGGTTASTSTSSAATSTATSTTSSLTPYAAPNLAAAALHEATTRHYSCILRSLRSALRDLQPTDAPQVLRVLAVLLLLSTYECLSWNITGGGVFAHLRASRQLIGWLRADDRGGGGAGGAGVRSKARLSPDERSMLGALLEIYAYQVLVNRICPDGSVHGRSAAGEGLTDDHNDEDFVADPSLLQDQDSFGMLFSGLHGLFALIPAVNRLAAAAVKPRASPLATATATATATFASSSSSSSPSTSTSSFPFPNDPFAFPPSSLSGLFDAYAPGRGSSSSLPIAAQVAALRNRALAWQLPAAFLTQASSDQDRIWQRAIGELYRHGVLIYIETIKTANLEDDNSSASTGGGGGGSGSSSATFQRHIHAIGEAVLGADLVASRFVTIMLWPLLIAGSILVHPDERMFLAEGLRVSPQATWSSIRAAELLEKLWARRDKWVQSQALARSSAGANVGAGAGYSSSSCSSGQQYFGPHGLAQIMRETNVNLCVG